MAHTYNLRARQSPSHSPPPQIAKTATTRRSNATQKEPAPSNPQKKVAAQGHTPQPTRQTKRSRPAEPIFSVGSQTGSPVENVVLRPPPTRQTKRSRAAEHNEERVHKRLRPNVETAISGVSSEARSPQERNNFKHSVVKPNRLRTAARDVWRIVAQTEVLIARASTSARRLLLDVIHLDAREESPVEHDTHEDRSVHTEPPADQVDAVPLAHERRQTDTRTVTEEDLEAFIKTFQYIRSEISGKDEKALSSKNMLALSTLCEDWVDENVTWHDCRCDAKQRGRAQVVSFSKPRPRVGVDQQGLPFHDWSACQLERWPPRRLGKERIVMDEAGILFNDAVVDDVLVLPAPLRPRRPRVFADQYQPNLHDIRKTVYRVLEQWHRVYGQCMRCILRAARTFPPWMITVNDKDQYVDGDPVFINNVNDELAEWDETGRRWRHLVLDHYRWMPVEELEERASDSAANPEILNGTTDTEVPFQHWAWA
ncbi:hypothetical protein PUNSTDRAFT_136714 [Punctularia strigosozonata HHB-11173 SS5]|uniref:uncharacterized protein n=1 Tax=Punctularia strigosozonata (strain HHB-11173) TaxID=741275 RepID=UPI000441703D|nr:uncharacterized protein PUNSTDRAFT_136714 [Punctularia strigosozonata HHB-11173 SS5]EIN06895.1 hypothetical protein PUNSTDRAFT_136714 [Punctularia strigosozonata HHB-11173 SS5]